MHPGFFGQWKRARRQAWREARAGCGHHQGHQHDEGLEASRGSHGGPPGLLFGVRRPLRFMAHKLDLDEGQVQVLARILDDLKTERAQASVDDRRTLATFAEALEAEAFDEERAKEGLDLRVQSAERLRAAVSKALAETHEMLNPEQRSKLAYMLRSGVLTI